MAIALLLLFAPAAVYLVSLPLTRRLSPRLRWTYRLLGGIVTLVGTAVTVFLAMYGGEQGGISAFFFQYGVIAVFIILATQTAAVHWILSPETARDRRRRLAWVLVALLVVLLAAVAYPRVKEFVLVDRCLDAGGAWDEVREECRFSDSKNIAPLVPPPLKKTIALN